MKLENLFFKYFFPPFLISMILSLLVLLICLGTFTFDKYDKRLRKKVIDLERNYSKIIMNSANILILNFFMKYQADLNEQIIYYQNKAKEILISEEEEELNTKFLECLITFDTSICDYETEELKNAFWLLDSFINEDYLDWYTEVKQQLIAYSHIIQNLNAIYESKFPNILAYFFYFEETELYISYPILDGCLSNYVYFMTYPYTESEGCNDDEGKPYDVFKIKCERYFKNIIKAKDDVFDKNNLSQNKTIFITNFYNSDEYNYIFEQREFTMCIEFDDPITEGKGYACADAFYTDLVKILEDLNLKIPGFFFISNVGFSNLLYYPQGNSTPKTSTEQIYNWDVDYILSEKAFFRDNTDIILTSNYIDYINKSFFDEFYEDGESPVNQKFYVNEEEFKYAMYPIIFENLNGKSEHVMSIIYIYNDQLFLDKLDDYSNLKIIMIISEIIIFIVFCCGLLYIIKLTFDTLTKYIVIPIKNVNYMMKGINIGGKDRLKYLEFLEDQNEKILEQLENSFFNELKDNKKENKNINETKSDSINKNNNEDDFIDIDKLINEENEQNEDKNNISDAIKKYDEETDYIEKEINFYDFDEQLLQYRSFEIVHLVKSLMELKEAKNFTSKNREVKNIINYVYSEKVFSNFHNKEGSIICQSNIGNLQSQLLKYDKAIYHLALSLEDSQLKKYLNQNLTDEFDEDDSLLNKISIYFNKKKKILKDNILAEKQMNNSKNNFSQQKIGILINIRYCRLIHAYYKFFKNLKKMQVLKDEKMTGQFMNNEFHTLNYYHKVLIQFIYLSYVKNDLIKIGESINDYIEFLIKFKFKTTLEDKHFLKINNRNNHKFKSKQEFKKKIFNKIVSWFNLFDDYILFVKDNSSLGDTKSIINDYSHSLNTENLEFNLKSQTAFMFKVNIQKNTFLKGKFCFYCKNYNDALFYFINAAKKNSIVIDGLIKKKSLKYIYKLLNKMKKKYEKLGLKNLNIEKELQNNNNYKIKIYYKIFKIGRKNENYMATINDGYAQTFGEELKIINEKIIQDISEFNSKQERDIIILIDFNIYTVKEGNISNKKDIIESFIEETLLIMNNYLSSSDRLGVIIYMNDFEIICPLIYINEIESENFSRDLNNYKNKVFDKENEKENSGIFFDKFNENSEFNLEINNDRINSKENSSEVLDDNEEEEINYEKIKGFVKTINYIQDYLEKKEGIKNEKYIIIFSDIVNIHKNEDKQIEKIFDDLIGDNYTILLLIGKNKELNEKNESKIIEELILDKFGEKSEIIFYDNMKKIKTILSNNKVIKEEIIYPNEIYK